MSVAPPDALQLWPYMHFLRRFAYQFTT